MKIEEIKQHLAYQLAEQIKNRLSQDDASQIQIQHREFILDAITYFQSRIDACISSLLSPNILTSFQQSFQQTLNEINDFFAKKNYGHINNAVNQINSTLPYVNQIPIQIPTEIKDIQNFILSYKSIVNSNLNEIENKAKDLNNKLKPISEQISKIQQDLTNQQTQINQLSPNFQNEFNQLKQKLSSQIDEERNTAIKNAKTTLDELNRKLDEAKKIVNIIGNIGVSGDYQKNAEYHRKQADRWRWIAVGSMGVSIIYLGWTVWNIDIYDWHISLLRILSTALFVYPAQYAASQSSKHREQEFYNKKLELDLAAISPFIELFDEKKKQEIKEKLVEKYFNPAHQITKTDNEIPLTIYEKIINQIVNIIKSVK